MKRSQVLGPVVLAGVGGAVNALLCVTGLPVATDYLSDFRWHLVPAGWGHGAALCLVPAVCAISVAKRPVILRWIMLPLAGFLSGYVSWVFLGLSLDSLDVYTDITWEYLWGFYQTFGFVGACYYVGLALLGGLAEQRLARHLAYGVVSGILGSLWWWIAFGPWFFSLLHGAVWGLLAGWGMWRAVTRAARGAASRA